MEGGVRGRQLVPSSRPRATPAQGAVGLVLREAGLEGAYSSPTHAIAGTTQPAHMRVHVDGMGTTATYPHITAHSTTIAN